MKKTKANNYIDNSKFFLAMKAWKEEYNEAMDSGEEAPPMTEYMGSCFLLIAEHLCFRPNFIGYSYHSDFISDSVENCILYGKNFDPAKSKNPFGYFTQIIYYAFLRRIAKEKKQYSLKHKIISESGVMDGLAKVVDIDNTDYIQDQVKYLKNWYNPDK